MRTTEIPAFPVDIDTTPVDDHFYAGLSRQDLKSHQAIGDLIDNGISASASNDFL